MEPFSTGMKISIETMLDEIQPVVNEKYQIECRQKPVKQTFDFWECESVGMLMQNTRWLKFKSNLFL